ncbi:MAG: galactose ABC transporter substrate-binding protein [Tissierellia bacterium]|nr:galactose ABC transporter substrate-binding protein [Tissierellia bacterium]
MTKRILVFLLVITLSVTMLAACGGNNGNNEATTNNEGTNNAAETEESSDSGEGKKVGVLFYKYNDPYISIVRRNLQETAEADGSITLIEQDGQDNQGMQNDQIDTVISQGVDVLLVNIVDTGAASAAIDKAKAADLPIIFFNREPENDDVYSTYEKSRFVGTKIEEAGELQGDMIAELWNKDTAKYDRNGNGKLDYVLLHGGIDNAEAVARSKYSVENAKKAGIEVNEIGMQIAKWDAEAAKNAMDAWLAKSIDDIDVVIANNDSMAIGAINSLKANGFNSGDDSKHILVFGVDALEEAQKLIEEGAMSGTVKQDGEAMAKALFDLAKNAAEGKDFLDGTDYEYDDSGVAVRIPYQRFEK